MLRIITGTAPNPTQNKVYNFTLKAQDAENQFVTRDFTLTVSSWNNWRRTRFKLMAATQLTRTIGSAGNHKKGTILAWIKKPNPLVNMFILFS